MATASVNLVPSSCAIVVGGKSAFFTGSIDGVRLPRLLSASTLSMSAEPRPAHLDGSSLGTCAAIQQSGNEEAWPRLSAVAASLSSASPEEDFTSFPSKELEPKIDLNLPRRRLQVSFTCDACGARSQRLINPNAYARGTIFVQCVGCDVYHKLVDNLGLIEEYDFRQETNNKADEADLNVPE